MICLIGLVVLLPASILVLGWLWSSNMVGFLFWNVLDVKWYHLQKHRHSVRVSVLDCVAFAAGSLRRYCQSPTARHSLIQLQYGNRIKGVEAALRSRLQTDRTRRFKFWIDPAHFFNQRIRDVHIIFVQFYRWDTEWDFLSRRNAVL